MKSLRVAIVVAFVFASCARQDWIDRTLVTVDVTGTWSGSWTGGGLLLFELEQQGPTVKGVMRLTAGTSQMSYQGAKSGPIEGTVAGDVFRFSQTNGSIEGEMTVSGDEMNGRASFGSQNRQFYLRRADPSRPASPPRQ